MVADLKSYHKDWWLRNRDRLRSSRKVYTAKYKREHKEAMDTYNKNRRKENAAFINKLKDKPCTDCGATYPAYVMEFDHLNGETKKTNVAWMRGWSKPGILAEVAKCEVVCANCHRIRTHTRGYVKVN